MIVSSYLFVSVYFENYEPNAPTLADLSPEDKPEKCRFFQKRRSGSARENGGEKKGAGLPETAPAASHD
ncbi:MAG: hypothetical protein M0Q48_09435 [Verrucomicrobia bacterium]|nr:hypothetical protein [Verrucomicrobiota bacterium]